MNAKVYQIYLRLPVFLQNILVSLYGYMLLRERYGRASERLDTLLKETAKLSAHEMEQYQEKAFLRIAHDAIENVPFYRQWAKSTGITKEHISKLSDIKRFPVLDRDQVVEDPKQFISERFTNDRLIKLSTSGSSGKPVTIYTNQISRTFHYCFFTRLRGWYGVKRGSKRITFFGRVVASFNQKHPPFWRYDIAQKNLLMSTFHLSTENLPHYYEKIKEFAPDEVFGYTSSIYAVARYIVESGENKLPAKLILCTAETLMPYQREIIEAAFDAPVVDQYGCTEMAFFASQCGAGEMHLHPEHSVCEVVDEEFQPCSAGEPGELLATGLVNEVMPLIRYRIGDRVSLSRGVSSKLPGFPIIESIEGRVDDLIYTKDGRTIGRLSPIFRSDKEISASQVIQNEKGDVLIKVVPTKNYTDFHRHRIYEDSVQRIGNSVPIEVVEVEAIDREANGKIKPVKSFYKGNDEEVLYE